MFDHLAEVLKRCEDCNLMLNWEKCHFMMKEGIRLNHRISKKGIEAPRQKVEVIEASPTHVSGRCEKILGHAVFYWWFI